MNIYFEHTFCAAHRLVGHKGKCANIHGHNYKVEIKLSSNQLNKLGMIMDFSEVKIILGGWIDEHWDHKLLLNQEDPLLDSQEVVKALMQHGLVALPFNPTAENMAKALLAQFNILLADMGYAPIVSSVRVYETDKGSAEAC